VKEKSKPKNKEPPVPKQLKKRKSESKDRKVQVFQTAEKITPVS
jgi:hypothetical protein